MLNNPTLEIMRELKLTGMVEAYRIQLESPKTFDMSVDERIGLLLAEERLYRENSLQRRLLARAKLRYRACIEDIDYTAKRGIDSEKLKEFATCSWVSHSRSCIITGPTGTGKSWLACAAGAQACRKGYSTFYIKASHLFEKLKLAHLKNDYLSLLNSFKKYSLLIIDDWGMEPFGQRRALDIQDILEDRYLNKSTLITSQFPVDKWHEIIDEPTIADAIIDRLAHSSIRLDLKGESLRAKHTINPSLGATS